jgi:hypothetical protein
MRREMISILGPMTSLSISTFVACLSKPRIPVIHFPCFIPPHSTLSGERSIRVRRLSAEDGHVPQGPESLDDALAHARGENAPCDHAKAAARVLVSEK